MAKIHGRFTIITVDGDNVKGTTSQFERTSDAHDVTEYGDMDHVWSGGLGGGTFSISGIYDDTAGTGPRAVLEPLIGSVVTVIRQPAGAGAGKAQDEVEALLTKYVETSPVADMVTWSADFNLSGAVDSTAQPA